MGRVEDQAFSANVMLVEEILEGISRSYLLIFYLFPTWENKQTNKKNRLKELILASTIILLASDMYQAEWAQSLFLLKCVH